MQLEFFPVPQPPPRQVFAKEWKIVVMRECPLPWPGSACDTPAMAAEYWRRNIAGHPYYTSEVECFAAIHLDTRRHVIGHHLVGVGLVDSVLVHPREVFRAAILAGASAVIVAHNHPSGDPTPSTADIRTTRDLIRAGQLLKIELLDHVVIGNPGHRSLKELGLFYA